MFFLFSFAFSVNFTRPKQITTSFIKLMVVAINITHFSTCLQRWKCFTCFFQMCLSTSLMHSFYPVFSVPFMWIAHPASQPWLPVMSMASLLIRCCLVLWTSVFNVQWSATLIVKLWFLCKMECVRRLLSSTKTWVIFAYGFSKEDWLEKWIL